MRGDRSSFGWGESIVVSIRSCVRFRRRKVIIGIRRGIFVGIGRAWVY